MSPIELSWTAKKQNTPQEGTGGATKTDEFSIKFQTAFAPPPHFRKIILQIFNNFLLKKHSSKAQKLQHKFWNENDPAFGTFPKIRPFFGAIRP